MTDDKTLKFVYKNWKEETKVREVVPKNIWYGSTEYHEKEQWLLNAHDLEKSADRDFALNNIIEFLE